MSEQDQDQDQEQSLIISLQHLLGSCSKEIEAGDNQQSEASISGLIELLTTISDASICDPENHSALSNSISVLSHIHSFLSNPSLDQAVLDALQFELPKAIAKFAGVSPRCAEVVGRIFDEFTTKCGPRDMIPVFTEALHSYGKTTDAPGYVAALLHGISKAFLSIQRRHLEEIKVAVPIILNALKIASFDLDAKDLGLKNLFEEAISITKSIQASCGKLEGDAKEQLRAILGLTILQIMSVVSVTMGDEVSDCLYLVRQLSTFLPYCGLLYTDLVTAQGVDPLISLIKTDDEDDYSDCFSYVKHGAVLSVIWAHISDEVTQAAGQDVGALKDNLRNTQSRRWSAIAGLKFVFSFDLLPWTLKKHGVELLLAITENLNEQEINDDVICLFNNTLSPIFNLQAIMTVIMNAPDAELRKNAWVAFKRVLADYPSTSRLHIIQLLVETSSSSSMTAILLDCVRENLVNDYRKLQGKKVCSSSSLWNAGILHLVEFVLRPPSGGPPLPEQTDAVLSALNLYRYVLMTESAGKTNYTEVLSRSSLQKVYNEWLLPLRTLVSGIIAADKDNHHQDSPDMTCMFNPVTYVLYRCIELVEEKLKQAS